MTSAVSVFSGLRFCAEERARALLPSTAGGWRIAAPQICVPVSVAPKTWRGTEGARTVCTAEYEGPHPVKLTVYYMPNEFASAFDAAQKFAPQEGKMAFFKGHYFGVAESTAADRASLERFVVAVEATLPPGNEWHR